MDELINQLLPYALLAARDGHAVTHGAAYLARYQLLLHYPLQEMFDDLAGGPVDLPTAGHRLAAVIVTAEPAQPAR